MSWDVYYQHCILLKSLISYFIFRSFSCRFLSVSSIKTLGIINFKWHVDVKVQIQKNVTQLWCQRYEKFPFPIACHIVVRDVKIHMKIWTYWKHFIREFRRHVIEINTQPIIIQIWKVIIECRYLELFFNHTWNEQSCI